MSVYLDPLMNHGGSATFKWTHSCHMFADTIEELNAFAVSIGLRLAWFQLGKGGKFPHYDLNAGRRRAAVRQGAIELDRRGAVEKWVELGFLSRKLVSEELEQT